MIVFPLGHDDQRVCILKRLHLLIKVDEFVTILTANIRKSFRIVHLNADFIF